MLQSYETEQIPSHPNWVEHTHIPSQTNTHTHSMAWANTLISTGDASGPLKTY